MRGKLCQVRDAGNDLSALTSDSGRLNFNLESKQLKEFLMPLRFSLLIVLVATCLGFAFLRTTTGFAQTAQIDVTTACAGQAVTAQVSWTPSNSKTWLDVSYLDNGWQESTFTMSGPAPADTPSA